MADKATVDWRRTVFSLVRIGFLSYLGLVVLMAGCQRHYIYYPERESLEVLDRSARAVNYEPWRNAEGRIIGWRPAGTESARRVVVFHGNAGHAMDRYFYAEGFRSVDEDWDVFLLEYPGYGARDGSPSEAAFGEAAEEALNNLWEDREEPVFLVGESLGSGVATAMARRFPERVSGLVLITPFTSLADVGSRHFPFLPVGLLLRDRFDNVEALKGYSGPVAVLLAEHDEVVPADLGRRLYEGYHGPRKLWIQEGRTHNTLDLSPGAPWWEEMAEFLSEGER